MRLPFIVGAVIAPSVGFASLLGCWPQTAHALSGRAVFQQTCAACHEGGIGGAPALRDKSEWRARLAKGKEALVLSALNGVRGMPARGGNGGLSEAEVRAAVMFMIERVR